MARLSTWQCSRCHCYNPMDQAHCSLCRISAAMYHDVYSTSTTEPQSKKPNVLEEAMALVEDGGDRNDSYDHPYPNFSKIAKTWEIIFGVPVTPRQVAQAMIAMKIVRDVHSPKRDNIVDIVGYARCIERLEEWKHDEADDSR